MGIVRKDNQTSGWWRRSRLVALTYSQMYLSQHFLRNLTSSKSGIALPERTFWMASQTIAAGVVLFSAVKLRGTTERLLVGQFYIFERPQMAQIILTTAVAFNVFLIAGPISALLAAFSLLMGLDWRILALLFQGIAIWKTSLGSLYAEFTWNILHIALAIGLMQAVHNFEQQEGLIALSHDEEQAIPIDEKVDEELVASEETLDGSQALPAGRIFIMFCVFIVFAGAIVMTAFFGLEKLLLPKLLAPKDDFNVEALVLSHMFTMEAVGIILVTILTIREISGNEVVRCILDSLRF
ncbi:hypothetical protein ABW20_dc0103506 [Dactylellina cionopaga]|nr:hypothetical protein ABW20_dc0103506 [Dactylellina cionopaga]